MSEAPLQGARSLTLQGYLTHRKTLAPGPLLYPNAQGPMMVLGGGYFFMSKVPL